MMIDPEKITSPEATEATEIVDIIKEIKESYANTIEAEKSFKAYIFVGNVKTETELTNVAIFADCLYENDIAIAYVNDQESTDDEILSTNSLDDLQKVIEQNEFSFFGNATKDSLDATIFCIIETDRERRLKYLEEIKKYAGDLPFKVIFLSYLDSLFLDRLKDYDIQLTDVAYAPYVSYTDFDVIGISGDWELSSNQSVNKERARDIFGDIVELFEMEYAKEYTSFTVAIHSILLKGSYDYLQYCFQQHIIKYGTLVNLNSMQINELMESFGFETLLDDKHNHIVLPDAIENSKIITEMVMPKHSIVSAAVVSESNRIDDIVTGALKVIVSNNISKIGIFGIPEESSVYARVVNNLTHALEAHVKETSLTEKPFTYTMYLIDHCNEKINTPEESIDTNFGFELAIVCDNKYFTITKEANKGDKGNMEFETYLENAKKKYTTLDINTGIVYCPVKKIAPEAGETDAK